MLEHFFSTKESEQLIKFLEQEVTQNIISCMMREEDIGKTKYNDMMFCVEMLKAMKRKAESSSDKSSK